MIHTDFSSYDSLLVNVGEDGHPISFNSDISLLQREEVLRMLPHSVDSLFDSSSQSNPYDNVSDDDIIENTKSRRMQSPSELMEWSQSLKNVANYKKFMSKKSSSSKSVSKEPPSSLSKEPSSGSSSE